MAEKAARNGEVVVIMVSTGGRDEAERLGEAMVVAGLVACASVVPTIHSIYEWEGMIRREHESLLLLKTSKARSAEAQEYIREHHPAQVPEILELPVTGGSRSYLDWVLAEASRPREAPVTE